MTDTTAAARAYYRAALAPLADVPWRQGRRKGRNIYAVHGEDWEEHPLIGQFDTDELAAEAVRSHNAAVAARTENRVAEPREDKGRDH